LLKTKVKPQFDRAVDRTVEALFFRFSGLQSGSISALFSRFYCPVGRGSRESPESREIGDAKRLHGLTGIKDLNKAEKLKLYRPTLPVRWIAIAPRGI